MIKIFQQKHTLDDQRGFTLVEMMVVLIIFAVLLGVVLFEYNKFNGKILLTNMAYEIGLQIREAQIFGLGARLGVGTTDNFKTPFGIRVRLGDGTGINPDYTKRVTMYNDGGNGVSASAGNYFCDGGCACTGTSGDECTEILTLSRDIEISRILTTDNPDPSTTCEEPDEVTISFKRPNPDAIMYDVTNPALPVQYQLILIEVVAPKNIPEYIAVRSTGQISVVTQTDASELCDL